MTRRHAVVAAALAAAAGWFWWTSGSPAEREIRRRLNAFLEALNDGTTDGLAAVARAARIGDYFAEDIVVELGGGSPPIEGRDTLIGMATRLQPRTAAFHVELDDVDVEVTGDSTAHVTLTALIRRRDPAGDDRSLDAREFAADLRKEQGAWRLHRIVAVDTLR